MLFRSTIGGIMTDITVECDSNTIINSMQKLQAEQNEDGTYHLAFFAAKEGVVL